MKNISLGILWVRRKEKKKGKANMSFYFGGGDVENESFGGKPYLISPPKKKAP